MIVHQVKSISELRVGDIVRHKNSNETFVITINNINYAVGIRAMHISNPEEWERLEQHQRK